MNIEAQVKNLIQKLIRSGEFGLAKKLAASYYKPMKQLYDPFKYPFKSLKEYREKIDSSLADFTTDQYIIPMQHHFTMNKGLYSQQDKIKSVEEYKKL